MVLCRILTLLAPLLLLTTSANSLGSCPVVFERTYELMAEERAKCTAKCNADGYCCTNDNGGCGQAPCTVGCLFAWYSASVQECENECEAAKGCEYAHPKSKDVHGKKHTINMCGGHKACGCPASDAPDFIAGSDWGSSDDCGTDSCYEGCKIANELSGTTFYGKQLTEEELAALGQGRSDNADLVDAALSTLGKHVSGTDTVSNSTLAVQAATILQYGAELKRNQNLVLAALDLIDAFENTADGPLFLSGGTVGGFAREAEGEGDGLGTARAMLTVQQAVIDFVYNANVIAECSRSIVQGRAWKTAAHFPGAAPLPDNHDATAVHTVAIKATVGEMWGIVVAFADEDTQRPTGWYLSPGETAEVTVPASLVGKKFQVLVGCNTVDNADKLKHRRMDRTVARFLITETTTVIANPLGGSVHILVPVTADEGMVDVQIKGGVVPAAFFRLTKDVADTTAAEWLASDASVYEHSRSAVAPWAEFETDHFLMQVPRGWIHNRPDPTQLLRDYQTAMEATSVMFGRPIETYHRHVLYLQPDLHIKHGAYGIGYPQVNTLYSTNQNSGNQGDWLTQDAMGWDVCWHELGHSQLNSMYNGEGEAINNFLYTYIENTEFGVDFDEAFAYSRGRGPGHKTVDQAALDWMVTPNFRDGNRMDKSNTEFDEFRYQHRGYAKYANIVQLFGWDVFTSFYLKENEDFVDGIDDKHGLSNDDSRTLKWSIQAGVDVTPLIEFWGVFPDDAAALKAKHAEHLPRLGASTKIRDLLIRYKQLIPADNAEFLDYFEEIHPGKPFRTICLEGTKGTSDYYRKPDGCTDPRYALGWYNAWRNAYNAAAGTKATNHAQSLIDRYFPDIDCVVCPTSLPECDDSACSSGECVISQDTCSECATATCKECIVCAALEEPECDAGCKDCVRTDATCTACGTATCADAKDDCVYCPQEVPQCDAGCDICQVAEATCDACAAATCTDDGDTGLGSWNPAKLEEDRSSCVAECNRDDQFCCTNNRGGCQQPTCAMGCLVAWFADDEASCIAECNAITGDNPGSGGCSYQHVPSDTELSMCGGPTGCGSVCGASWGIGDDCNVDACHQGCRNANADSLRADFFNGANGDSGSSNTGGHDDCVFCAQEAPECGAGCQDCRVSEQSCSACPSARCHDDDNGNGNDNDGNQCSDACPRRLRGLRTVYTGPTPPPPTTLPCKSWCAANDNPFKCTFTACAGCPECEPATTSPPPTSPPPTSPPPTSPPKDGTKKIFLVAGQSNAEGNVKLSGLRGLAAVLPKGKAALSSSERTAARAAVLDARGFMCDAEVANAGAADVVIDSLRTSTSGWQDIDAGWLHSSATITSANFRYRAVTLVAKADVGAGTDGDGIPDIDYCTTLCMDFLNSEANPDESTGCYDPFCGSNQLMSCSQACKAKRAGATASECLGVCQGPRKCTFALAGLEFPACSSCGISQGYEHECTILSTSGCTHACNAASGSSGTIDDAPLVEDRCNSSPADTVRTGPDLSRYSPKGVEMLAPGYGSLSTEEVTFGPELVFGKVLGDRLASQTAIVKVAMGGSSLADHWRVGGTLYNQLIADATEAQASSNGVFGGFVWFQGFNDQFDDVWCRSNVMDVQYEQNLRAFFDAVRSDLGVADLPIVIVKARNGGDAMTNIQVAQESVVFGSESTQHSGGMDNVALVRSDDTSECFHYDSGAQAVIGERAAEAMLQLLGNT